MNDRPDLPDIILDTKGLNCPLPVLRARKRMAELAPGGVMRVLATDPAALADFRAFCGQTGHDFIGGVETGPGMFEITIRRKADPASGLENPRRRP